MDLEKEGCNPACVVSAETKEAEINWRCTGALEPRIEAKEKSCTDKSGDSMSLDDAIAIASKSECGKNGLLTNSAVCNSYTGTWWIDLDIEKEGCSPACVIKVSEKEAEINWRCTGLAK